MCVCVGEGHDLNPTCVLHVDGFITNICIFLGADPGLPVEGGANIRFCQFEIFWGRGGGTSP